MANALHASFARSIREAIERGDLALAAKHVASFEASTAKTADLSTRCMLHWWRGRLRDEEGRLAEAEEEFLAALALDEELGRPVAAAHTLHSLYIVRKQRGDHAGALDAAMRGAQLRREHAPKEATLALTLVGSCYAALNATEAAVASAEDAIASIVPDQTPSLDAANAFLASGAFHLKIGRVARAYSRFKQATCYAASTMDRRLADRIGVAWYELGVLARDHLTNFPSLAEVGLWFATLTLDRAHPLAPRAASEWEALGSRRYSRGDPDAFRVIYCDANITEFAAVRRGTFQIRQGLGVPLGTIVDVVLDDRHLKSVRVCSDQRAAFFITSPVQPPHAPGEDAS